MSDFNQLCEFGRYADIVDRLPAPVQGRSTGIPEEPGELYAFGLALVRLEFLPQVELLIEQGERLGRDEPTVLKISCLLAVQRRKWPTVEGAVAKLLTLGGSRIISDDQFLFEMASHHMLSLLQESIPELPSTRLRAVLEARLGGRDVSEPIEDMIPGAGDLSVWRQLLLSVLLSEQLEFDKALGLLNTVLQARPGQSDALYLRLHVLSKLGREREMLGTSESRDLAEWHPAFARAYRLSLLNNRRYTEFVFDAFRGLKRNLALSRRSISIIGRAQV